MFNINKPAFGTPTNNTASFFTSTPSRFGENFAKPNTPNFGEFNKPTMAPNFGNAPFANTSNNTNNSAAFASNPFRPSSNGQPIFGNNLFNTSTPQQSNDFFGNQFNQNEKSAFSFTPKPTEFVFGQSNPQSNVFKPQSGTSIFPASSNFGPPASPAIPPGTVVKFVPVKLTDTSIIKGINQTINGRNQCITCMKEYEDKSLEELRLEDYQANRKGPQENFFFNNTTNEPMSMEAPTMNIFSQENNVNKNLFGYKFGTNATTASNAPTGLFGKSVFGFGNTNTAAQSTASNFFGTTNTNTNTNTNFQTQSSMFNQQQQQQQQQQPQPPQSLQQQNQTTNSNIFNRNTPFGTNPTTINNNLQQSNLFPGLNTNTTFSFGNTPTVTTAAVGQSSFSPNLFNSSLMKPSTNTQPSAFNTSFKSAFPSLSNHASTSANTNNSNIFKFNPTTPQQNIFSNPQQQQQQPYQYQHQHQQPPPIPQNQYNFSVINQSQNHDQILSMSSHPYGLSDLLNNINEIDNNIKDTTRATNPNELKTLLETVKPETKKIHDKLQPIQIFRKADQSMFDGLEVDESLTQQRNPKKLVLRKYSFVNENNEPFFCSDLNGIFENMNRTLKKSTSVQSVRDEETVETATQVENEIEEITITPEMKEVEDMVAIHPTGIILTRPEYYTVPPLEELIDYINEDDGSCIVQGFTVGRLGYGNVYFPDAFDVSHLNLDELVHFCYKEVTIYPDDTRKPPQGEGLNRKAQITLDKVWPYDKKTNMLITDIDALTEMDYADRLRRLCDRQQSKFVDYRLDTGSWVFRVEHFSKYGVHDGDDDDIGDETEDLITNDDLIRNDNIIMMDNIIMNDSQNEQHITDDFSKCTLMKSTFFDDFSSEMDFVSITDKLDFFNDSSSSILNVTLPLDIFSTDDNDELEDVRIADEMLFQMVPLKKSYFNYFKIYCDVAGFKGRSFKIGWSKHMQFTTLTRPNNIYENSIQINQMKTYSDSSILHQCLEEHLNVQLNNSQYNSFNNNTENVPNFSSTLGLTLLQDHQEENCCSKNNFESDVWKLCNALWEQQQQQKGQENNIGFRKQLLTTWLQNVIQKDIVFTDDDGPYNTIIKYLSLYRIEDAAKYAFQQNHIHLSMLISQLPSNILIRNYLMKQLCIWRDMPDLIDFDLLKIYLLIAGLPKIQFTNNKTTICIYEKMNWLQVLAFYLWYIIREEETISNGINLFEHSFMNNNDIMKPFPIKFLPDENESNYEIFDLRFQLLKYYSDNKYPIANVLNPLAHTSNILDYRFSWFLMQILESLSYSAEMNPKMKQFIHLNFAAQLEEMQQWHWAVFILLFIEDVHLKTILVQEVINRNIEIDGSLEYRKREQFLIHTLRIPSTWLETAKATFAISLGQNQQAICYLCYAGRWNDAYSLLMDMLLPNHFFSYDYEFLSKILTPLSHHKSMLPNWDQTGGLILDFAQLGIEYNTNTRENDCFRNWNHSHSIRFRSSVVNIHARFRDISDLSYIRHVCRAGNVGHNWSILDHLLN